MAPADERHPELEEFWKRFCRHPDEAHFAPVYEATRAMVYTLCLQILRREDDALDAFQATYCRLLALARGGGKEEGDPGEFRWLLYRIVLGEARNLRGRLARRRGKEVAVENLDSLVTTPGEQVESVRQIETRRVVGEMLAQLPAELGDALTLHLMEGLSQTEIAAALGVSKMTVSRRVEKGRRCLKNLLGKAGFTNAASLAWAPVPLGLPRILPPGTVSMDAVFAKARASLNIPPGKAIPRTEVFGIVSSMLLILIFAGLALMQKKHREQMQEEKGAATERFSQGGNFPGWSAKTLAGGAVALQVGSGLGIHTPAGGIHWAEWQSPYPLFAVRAGSAYQIRLKVHSDQKAAGRTPLWNVALDNYSPSSGQGANAFSVESSWLDYMGGANSAGMANGFGRTSFEAWLVPACVLSAAWNDPVHGMFSKSMALDHGARLRFRVIDSNRSGVRSDEDEGTVILDELEVVQFRFQDIHRGEMVYATKENAVESPAEDAIFPHDESGVEMQSAADAMRMIPADETAYHGASVTMAPGAGPVDFTDRQSLENHFPIHWESDQLYLVGADFDAGRNLALDPREIFLRLGMDSPTQEVGAMNLVSSGLDGRSLPQPGKPQTFYALFYSHSPTLEKTPGFQRLRPLLDATWRHADGKSPSAGGRQSWIALHGLRVYKANFPRESGTKIYPGDEGAPVNN